MELLDKWWSCSLAEDHHAYLCGREKSLPVYQGTSSQMASRRYLVDWLSNVCDAHDLCTTARHLMVALLDHFMEKFVIAEHQLKLAALASLLVACKYEDTEIKIPRIEDLNKTLKPPQRGYTKREFTEMELAILGCFQWNISLPTAAHFVDYFLIDAVSEADVNGFWPNSNYDLLKAYMMKYVYYFLEISLQDSFYRRWNPSLVCAASVACARICLRLNISWNLDLQIRTKYRFKDLIGVIEKMMESYRRDERATKLKQSSSESLNCRSTSTTAPERSIATQELLSDVVTSIQNSYPVMMLVDSEMMV